MVSSEPTENSWRQLSDLALTICIPVFNDEKELAKTLRSLRDVASISEDFFNAHVEVLISDNHSTDGSPVLIDSLELGEVRIQKFRQPANLGFRGNIEFLSSKAHGEWILFASCGDEFVTDFSFEKAIADLASTPCDTAFFQFEMLDTMAGSRFHDSATHDVFQSAQQEIIYSAAPMPFFRTKTLAQLIASRPKTSGNWWPQVEWALAASKTTGQAAYITPGPITGNRPDTGWWARPLAYLSVIELARLLEEQALDHSASAQLISDSKKAWRSLPGWVFQTRVVFGNRRSTADFKALVAAFRYAPMVVLVSLGVLLSPLMLLNLVRSVSRISK